MAISAGEVKRGRGRPRKEAISSPQRVSTSSSKRSLGRGRRAESVSVIDDDSSEAEDRDRKVEGEEEREGGGADDGGEEEVLQRELIDGDSDASEEEEEEEEEEEYEMEKILKHKNAGGEFFYKIKWKGYPDEESTWEPETNINGTDMLQAYWKKHPHAEKQARKAYVDKNRRAPISSPAKSTNWSKSKATRSSSSVSAIDTEDRDEDSLEDVDVLSFSEEEDGGSRRKRRRPSRIAATRAVRTMKRMRLQPIQSDESERDMGEAELSSDETASELSIVSLNDIAAREDANYEAFMKIDNWDGKVMVENLERTKEGKQILKARVKSLSRKDPAAFWVSTKIANKRCPQAIISFYEKRVTFKSPPRGREE